MKSTGGDKMISEKLDGLDTLGGGIVFGKEEAWDKLQARLEKKPVRIIPLRMWIAAAAVLLLMMGAVGFYYYPARQVAQTEVKKQLQQPIPAYTATTQTSPNTIPIKEEPKNIAVANRENKYEITAPQLINEGTLPAIGVTSPAPVIEPQEDKKIANRDEAQVLYATARMKVVHINELGEAQQATGDQYPTATDVAVNTNVVHINDLAQQSTRHLWLQNLQSHHDNFVVNFSFFKTTSLPNEQADDLATPHNALKFKIN